MIRYVVTVPCKDGLGRTLMRPCQGCYTYATQEEAQDWIDGYTRAERLIFPILIGSFKRRSKVTH